MDLCMTVKGVSFLLQTSLGILGNVMVLLIYSCLISSNHRLHPVDIILTYLSFVNLMIILTRGVPQTLIEFGFPASLNDMGCKVVVYIYRISRALSVSVTCMLSVFQSITIAPATSRLNALKANLPQLVLPTFSALCVVNMSIDVVAVLFAISPRNGTIPRFTLNLGFCHVDFRDQLGYVLSGASISARDFIFLSLMITASSHILLILHRHGKQMKTFNSTGRNQGSAAETRAAKTVVSLVTLYAFFFGIDNTIYIYMLTVSSVPPSIVDMRLFFSSCYASFCPFFMINTNKKLKNAISCSSTEAEAPQVSTILKTPSESV
ncbi:olfactory receptor class A-like protein 1 [Erpetoichthys calabaricus]|uniref:Vomeronasal type-1 receptor n=1 Tax=Erpetoichthys calabaricus TaxID=27687 RepID=A0A8C4SWH8_ERPCA|nr:olfactory receptor class A-like protein 1 [Erpetoichthys calabaricus]